MAADLKKMSRKELEKLARDVEKALDKMRKQDLKKVRQEMEKIAAAHGVSVDDVVGQKTKPKTAVKTGGRVKSAPKYANPADKSQTWTGKGRQPEWFKSAVASGTDPETMAI